PPHEEDEPEEAEPERVARDMQREATRAQRARERALKRVGSMKDGLLELEAAAAAARRDLRGAGEARERLEAERDRLARERDALRGQLQEGTGGEGPRLQAALDHLPPHARAPA